MIYKLRVEPGFPLPNMVKQATNRAICTTGAPFCILAQPPRTTAAYAYALPGLPHACVAACSHGHRLSVTPQLSSPCATLVWHCWSHDCDMRRSMRLRTPSSACAHVCAGSQSLLRMRLSRARCSPALGELKSYTENPKTLARLRGANGKAGVSRQQLHEQLLEACLSSAHIM